MIALGSFCSSVANVNQSPVRGLIRMRRESEMLSAADRCAGITRINMKEKVALVIQVE